MEKSTSPVSDKEMSLKRKFSIEFQSVECTPDFEAKFFSLLKKNFVFTCSNGKPNKKIIKLLELTKMDPLEYFSRFLDIREMIFHHLNGKDLIKASEVNPSYYNFIASSKVLMKNILVAFDVKRLNGNPEIYNLLKNSSRLYQSIEVRYYGYYGNNVTNSELDVFQSHEWKNVSFDNIYFRKKRDMWRLFSSIESSVESIFVMDDGVLSFEEPTSEVEYFEPLKFPKLKKLQVYLLANESCGDTLVRFLINCVAVEELCLVDFSGKIGKDILTKMLENFDNLRSLEISSDISGQIFEDESWKQFKFKLKSLTILVIRVPNTNFRNFLISQSDHLEKLITELHVEDKETFDVIMKMPKLKSLGLKYSAPFSVNEIPTKISNSITDLSLFECANAVSLKFLLHSMPKVKKIQIPSINEEIFKMLKSMNRKFEELRVLGPQGVDRKEVEEIFENYSVHGHSNYPFEFFTGLDGE